MGWILFVGFILIWLMLIAIDSSKNKGEVDMSNYRRKEVDTDRDLSMLYRIEKTSGGYKQLILWTPASVKFNLGEKDAITTFFKDDHSVISIDPDIRFIDVTPYERIPKEKKQVDTTVTMYVHGLNDKAYIEVA